MGFFDFVTKPLEKAVNKVFVEPAKAVEQAVVHTTQKAEQAVVKTAQNLGKDVDKAVKVAGKDIKIAAKETVKIVKKVTPKVLEAGNKALDFTAEHAGQVAKVGETVAKVVSAIGVATGQPEIIAAAGAIEGASLAIGEAGVIAKQLQSTRDKVKKHVEIIKQKKDLSSVLHATADILSDAGEISGNQQIKDAAAHIKKGARVVDKAQVHMSEVLQLAKGAKQHLDDGDIKALVGDIKAGFSKAQAARKLIEGRALPKTSADLLLLLEEFGADFAESTPAPKPKKVRKSRARKVAVAKVQKKPAKKVKKRKVMPAIEQERPDVEKIPAGQLTGDKRISTKNDGSNAKAKSRRGAGKARKAKTIPLPDLQGEANPHEKVPISAKKNGTGKLRKPRVKKTKAKPVAVPKQGPGEGPEDLQGRIEEKKFANKPKAKGITKPNPVNKSTKKEKASKTGRALTKYQSFVKQHKGKSFKEISVLWKATKK